MNADYELLGLSLGLINDVFLESRYQFHSINRLDTRVFSYIFIIGSTRPPLGRLDQTPHKSVLNIQQPLYVPNLAIVVLEMHR